MNTGPRPAAYTRVSDPKQAQRLSLSTQWRLIQEHARRVGLPEPTLFEERGESAFTDDLAARPVFARLVAAIEAGEFDQLITIDQDRFARDAALALIVANRLVRAGCRILFLNQPGADVATPDGKFLFTIGAGLSELYSAQISRKVRAANDHIRAEGGHVGAPPWGSRRNAQRRLEIDPAKAETLAYLLRYAAEQSNDATAAAMTAAGYPPPRRNTRAWYASTVRNIVDVGRWLLDQPEPWPTLYLAAAARPRLTHTTHSRAIWTLTGICRCICGGVIVHCGRNPRKDAVNPYWIRCHHVAPDRPTGHGCPGRTKRSADHYEALVTAWLLSLPDLTGLTVPDGPDPAVTRADITRRRQIAFDGYQTGVYDRAEYLRRAADLAAEERAVPLSGARAEVVGTIVREVQQLWSAATPVERNAYLRALVEYVEVDGSEIRVVPRADLAAVLAIRSLEEGQ